MSLSLGEKLRQAREELGISASEVAEQTRISPLYINAIERDDYKPLPGGIFNKGFVKSYAKFVGMDEQEALQDYSKIVAKTEGFAAENDLRVYKPEVLTDDNSISSMIPTIIFAGIILALMTGGILFVVNYFQNQPDRQIVTNNNMANDSNSPQTAIPAPQFDQITLEFKALAEKISVKSTIDGTESTGDILQNSPKTFTARESLALSYYKGFSSSVELTLNGKRIEPPAPPARGNSVLISVNKENVRQIWDAGSFVPPAEAVPATTPATTTPTQTPRPETTVQPTNAATPQPTPARTATPRPSPTRTPIIVGNSSPANRP